MSVLQLLQLLRRLLSCLLLQLLLLLLQLLLLLLHRLLCSLLCSLLLLHIQQEMLLLHVLLSAQDLLLLHLMVLLLLQLLLMKQQGCLQRLRQQRLEHLPANATDIAAAVDKAVAAQIPHAAHGVVAQASYGCNIDVARTQQEVRASSATSSSNATSSVDVNQRKASVRRLIV